MKKTNETCALSLSDGIETTTTSLVAFKSARVNEKKMRGLLEK
jgi:hypothetical protein